VIGRVRAAAGDAVAAGLASALCCAGPLVAVALGVSGAGLASTFEPLRPYFIGATVLALGAGHWSLRREEANACVPGKPCADPRTRRVMRWTLWGATVLAAVFATFPYWSAFVL
jgi:mercuric ion transport protein